MAKIENRGDFKKWLEGKPVGWAQTLALRSALRCLPIALDPANFDDGKLPSGLTTAVMRAITISWAVRYCPAHNLATEAIYAANTIYAANAIKAAALAIANAADAFKAAAYAVADAADAGADAAYAVAATAADAAATAADAAATAADADIWAAISGDRDFLENTDLDTQAGSLALLAQPLWYGKALLIPESKLEASWKRARENLKTEKFDIWSDWYHRRLTGEAQGFDLPRIADLEIQSRLLDQDDEWWARGLGPVTKDIEGWIRELRPPSKKDFFISYSSENEDRAREINQILTDTGYSTIVQFKDFGAQNFVEAMDKGLEQSNRFIALYSQDYLKSGFCYAEWAAAFGEDPKSKNEKIVAFLLEPCDLTPLMKQIRYKSLVGLSRLEREQAVLEFVGKPPAAYTPATAAVRLAEMASPDVGVNSDGVIDITPNPLFDQPISTMDMADTIEQLLTLLDTIIPQMAGNMASFGISLNSYRDKLNENSKHPVWGPLDRLMAGLDLRIQKLSEADVELDQLTYLRTLPDLHAHCKTLLRHSDEKHNIGLELPVKQEADVVSGLQNSNDAAKEAESELDQAKLQSDAQRDHFRKTIKTGQELENQPYCANVEDERMLNRANSEEVQGRIGYYKRMLDAIDSSTSIADSSAGKATTKLLKTAMDELVKLLF